MQARADSERPALSPAHGSRETWPRPSRPAQVVEAVRDGRSEFDEALKHAQDAGFTTVRFFAHGSLRGDALQTSPGVYNE